MGDLKTPWPDKDQAFTGTDMSGAGVTQRGSDPNADGNDGEGGLKSFWDEKRALPENANPGNAESANSVSGLPPLPNRFEPSETPPEMPDLTDRSPGTIDKK
jgi:hypothetical protein